MQEGDERKNMIIHNPTDTDVLDYPIQNPQTGEVALWSIRRGETLDFPVHEGKYLLGIYAFLQRIITQDQLESEKREEQKLNKGQHFDQVKIVGDKGFTNENMQPPAPTSLAPQNPVVTPPEQQPSNNPTPPAPEMSGAVDGDAAAAMHQEIPAAQASTAPAPQAPNAAKPAAKPGDPSCPECNDTFKNKAAMKIHYASKHLDL